MVKQLVNRASCALRGEDGGPSVEQIVGISVALIIATAFIVFAGGLGDWIGGAEDSISGLSTGENLDWSSGS